MNDKFRILTSNDVIDIIPYCRKYIQENPETEILIGCDSQSHKSKTYYATVLALYKPGKGGHVLYKKTITNREKDNGVRLINEVWFSTELAEFLLSNGLPRAKFIDIDLNPDPKWESNKQLQTAVGIVKGMGYNVRHKGDDPLMTYAADKLVKK